MVNNSGMSLWEALLPLGLVLGLIILCAVGTGLALSEILGRRKCELSADGLGFIGVRWPTALYLHTSIVWIYATSSVLEDLDY